ncbi:MAG: peptide chain release factor 1 [Fimbriimonadaceae bacterium]|nr:peptide chain release factor 1 [Fimbriimonadaceae bacterium]QYK57543.1 MAG: peptide chain release factor 1 [Fimbriimonadaceae bacterium]
MLDKLDEIERRYEEIDAQLQDPAIAAQPKEMQRLGKARREIEELVGVIREYKKAREDLVGAQALLSDPEMREMAQAEVDQLKQHIEGFEGRLKVMLLPKDPNDDKAVIIEIRPAAGGDEAGLFANELFRMYARYAERRKWKYEVIEHEESGIGGVSRVVFEIAAEGAYSQLKHESGVHRVQRVPATESQGRLHTSTVTVAVLPEAEEAEIEVNEKDLEVSTFRASSAGGQHVQKNETAIRIIHKPSGIVVTCQDERSQQQNKLRAMSVLRAKLYEAEQERLAKERGEMRRGQIGSGDRSEKIRTYHFVQNRVTDHRIGKDVHNILTFMDGDLQAMIDALNQEDQARKIAEELGAAAGV